MEKDMVTTERMNIFPISIEKLKEIVEQEENEILKIAYQEMLDGCLHCYIHKGDLKRNIDTIKRKICFNT